MKVYGRCHGCKKPFSVRTDAHTRVEFAMNHGEVYQSSCTNCGFTSRVHVDKLKAKPVKVTFLLIGMAIAIGAIILLYFLFFVDRPYVIVLTTLPFVVYFIIKKQDQTRVSDFNSRKLKGRTHNIV
jgi:hypothetical protein